jgi:O-acetyl-ADP-ribose deacetylase (regulator of RNase III)
MAKDYCYENMLIYHRTSLLKSKAQTVVNTVNTVGVMGKGLAAAFKQRYPAMFERYKILCDTDQLKIGNLWLWKSSDQWVLNFPTKTHWRFPSKLEYIERGLEKFVAEYETRGITEVSFPRLGCGNGGLKWKDVRPLMERYLSKLPIQIYIHDYEKDIGVPEHYETAGLDFERTYERFLRDVIAAADDIVANPLKRRSISESAVNKLVKLLKTTTHHNDTDVSERDDIYALWLMLLRGPLTKDKLVGSARDNSSAIFQILDHLPYLRPIEVQRAHHRAERAYELAKPSMNLLEEA